MRIQIYIAIFNMDKNMDKSDFDKQLNIVADKYGLNPDFKSVFKCEESAINTKTGGTYLITALIFQSANLEKDHRAEPIKQFEKQKDFLRLLLLHPGLNINVRDALEQTPLFMAAMKGGLETLRVFLFESTHDIDLDATDLMGDDVYKSIDDTILNDDVKVKAKSLIGSYSNAKEVESSQSRESLLHHVFNR